MCCALPKHPLCFLSTPCSPSELVWNLSACTAGSGRYGSFRWWLASLASACLVPSSLCVLSLHIPNTISDYAVVAESPAVSLCPKFQCGKLLLGSHEPHPPSLHATSKPSTGQQWYARVGGIEGRIWVTMDTYGPGYRL
ncbi:hypothetical protein B0H10DRAFT_1958535 [Mycena sp. CBHHK59/15]|nr:hypothetical protein B0H10DRAFT_1958535 [Mycena sp. CBHHK59/15]